MTTRNDDYSSSRPGGNSGSIISTQLSGSPADDDKAAGWTLISIAAAAIVARLYLRLKIQRRGLLRLGALESAVMTDMKGFSGDPKDIPKIIKVTRSNEELQIFLWISVGYVAVSLVTGILLLLCGCIPLESIWDKDVNTCPVSQVQLIFHVSWGLHFVGDLLVFILPWFVVTGLNMRRALKIGVYCTFLLGLINITFDILRVATLTSSKVGNAFPFSLIVLWDIIDCNIGVVIACLPALRPYFNNSESKQTGSSGSEAKSWPSASSGPSEAVRAVNHVGPENQHNANSLGEETWADTRTNNWSEVELSQANSRVAEIA
ncbi:hypothetical protein G7Z17_g9605 [Cylindrodendrum hubeiense]|uniref:Rhodopsin domain-containing protein n=1 Tax=Cylindrodendrum hubeiense TaxID=595255 RepID=A0A9P5L7Z6_9HYPO|nr:hypothetical protein G7Z17_g9605 [Cylindrodendrum hubeiense]